jgi:hypothetical protein
VFEERNDKRFLHIPSVAYQQRFTFISSVIISEEYEVTGNFEFGSVFVFIHEVHVDRNGCVFTFVFRNGEKGNEELRKGVIRPVGFVSVVEVEVGTGSTLRRSKGERVINGPNRP